MPLATLVVVHDASQPYCVSVPVPTSASLSAPPETRNSTFATLTLSDALASRTALPATLAPAAGTRTRVVGAVLSTVTETGELRVKFPAVSYATLLRV